MKFLQLAALLSTAYLSLASICSGHHGHGGGGDCPSVPAEARSYEVNGSCGAAGVVTITTRADCGLGVDGGTSVGLPVSGTKADGALDAAALQLHGEVALEDGGVIPRHCERRLDGGSSDGGIALDCDLGDTSACSAELTPL